MTNDASKLLLCAKYLAQAIVENGGEIYRAEEAVHRINNEASDLNVDAFALPTGVFITVTCPDGQTFSSVCRFKMFRTDLNALDKANSIARKLASGSVSADEAVCELEKLIKPSAKRTLASSLIPAFAAACISILFGGGMFEFAVSCIGAFLAMFISGFFDGEDMYNFISSLIVGAVSAVVGVIFVVLFGTGSLDIIIAASIFPLLPGMMLVNAIRDSVHGDLISGVAKLGDVFVVVLALAAGTGTIIWLYSFFGGVM